MPNGKQTMPFADADHFAQLIRRRRSVRDFLSDPIPEPLLQAVLDDAIHAPSWSNTQPYRIAVATGVVRDRISKELCDLYDAGIQALRGSVTGRLRSFVTRRGWPDGDFKVNFPYPPDLQSARRATGFGLYRTLGIERHDLAARDRQMRRNFEFFGAPAALFIFVHGGLREYGVLDAGILMQSLMLSAEARGLSTCAQGALATWASPVRRAFHVPAGYKLIAGISIGYASAQPVNRFDPGRASFESLSVPLRSR
jgi:nitroreductase